MVGPSSRHRQIRQSNARSHGGVTTRRFGALFCRVLAAAYLFSSDIQAQGLAEFSAGITPGAQPFGITAGPDVNLWFTEQAGNRIGRISPSGVLMEFSAGIGANANLQGIALGPDGNLWFTEVNLNQIGQITPSGVVTEFSTGIQAAHSPSGSLPGPTATFGSLNMALIASAESHLRVS